MADPWLHIIGLGEDGPAGLSEASRAAIGGAEVIFGGPRHLALAGAGSRGREWPVPFAVDPVLREKGRRVVVLASGDPFWFGAGGSLVPHLSPGEWVSHPAPSAFQLAANALGWRMEEVTCLGQHAKDIEDMRPHLQRGARLIVTLRDANGPDVLAYWLKSMGFGETVIHVMERLGGPESRIRTAKAAGFALKDIAVPVMAAFEPRGSALGLPRSPGLPDDAFMSDGQMTKSHIRALTIAALAPRPGEMLWDLGAGAGTVSVEWCLAGGHAVAVEHKDKRLVNIRANARSYAVQDRLTTVQGKAMAVMGDLPRPDAVFVGGGASEALFQALWKTLPPDTRVVVNAVTLETEALLIRWHEEKGGNLFRFEISNATNLGMMRGWDSIWPVVQWVAEVRR